MNITSFAIINELLRGRVRTPTDLADFKRIVSKKYKIPCPSNIELLKDYHNYVKNRTLPNQGFGGIERLLITRPVRSLSGIVNVSVLTKPYSCPGKCIYCPTEKGIPKSYLSGEPAVERAKKLKYGPYLQVKKRLEMLEAEGHPTDKIDLRLIGGTWSYYPKDYQNWFIRKCFQACNEFGYLENLKLKTQKAKQQLKTQNLKNVQRINEKAKHRIIGISVETRPDFINEKEVKRLRDLGVTRVELGVQSIYDDVLKLVERGHATNKTILATKLLKNGGFKICYQMMPNLPGSNFKKDEAMFEELFENPDFQPDYLKIYPCAVLKEAPLYNWWKTGKYKPYTKEKLLDLIKKIKKKIPYYVRIQRITRDIPSPLVASGGAKISNLRQIIQKEMEEEDWKCKCVRCREIKGHYEPKEKFKLFRENYGASDGKEIFLSIENKGREKLYSLLRLRIPFFKNYETRPRSILSVLESAAIIREMQTFGEAAPLGVKKIAPQHRGLGKKLLKEAEKIAKKEFGLNKIAVIAGVGAREYFRKLGYTLKDTYMVKEI